MKMPMHFALMLALGLPMVAFAQTDSALPTSPAFSEDADLSNNELEKDEDADKLILPGSDTTRNRAANAISNQTR